MMCSRKAVLGDSLNAQGLGLITPTLHHQILVLSEDELDSQKGKVSSAPMALIANLCPNS